MDIVLSPLVKACIGKVADLTGEKVGMIMGVKDELLRLHRRLIRLSLFLEDAEKKGIHDTSIRNWLGELKDVVYDAEDILDLCRVHPTNLLEGDLDQQPPSVRSSQCFPLISCFTGAKFRHEIAEEIKKLNDRLEEIEHDSSVLSKLNTSRINKPVDHSTVGREVDHRRQTTPLLVKSEVIGQQMEVATEFLVESLIHEDNRKCSVFGVVGMGGIGKTTLARKIYNHASINQHFPTSIWVCVSQTYSDTELLKQIIRGANTKAELGEANTKAELAPILTSVLSKNFFLVLDDIWSADVWENLLQKPLECAAASGRVLVTSRNEDIAKRMLAKKVYNVPTMNNNDGWVLLCKKVFGDSNEEVERLGLKDIGIQIVNKCHGLPLAIEVIGGVLRTKDNTRSEWGKILGSNAWSMVVQGELMGALYLSYEDLPAHLKQCFLYCSLYPEDYYIERRELIRYWVAEGFIRSADGGDAGILMEDIADDYYMELDRRSLLQESRMHDMLRSLAQFLIGGESVCLVAGPDATTTLNVNSTTLQKLRRLSLVISEEVVIPAVFNTMKREHLRTLLCFVEHSWTYPQQLAENSSLFLGRHLRVLNLARMNIENLPDSLGNLVHLRHLGLDSTRISQLPDSMQNLVNLQNLSLSCCSKLLTLPKGITQLYSLRYLNIRGTQLIRMPKGLDQMKQLNHLVGYSAGDETDEVQSKACNMDELRNLSQLRWLYIENLERATTGTPAIINKPFLKEMHLIYNWKPPTTGYGEADIQIMEKVLEELFPPQSVQLLTVIGYPGRGYPSWMSTPSSSLITSSLPHLETISLYYMSWTQLPPLGQLPQLKFFKIESADAIVSVGPEFVWGGHGSVQCVLPRLETLALWDMSNWEEWTLWASRGYDDDEIKSGEGLETTKLLLPRLRRLHLLNCPKLRSLPAGLSHANKLESMSLGYLHKIIEVNRLPWLTDLEINSCTSLERISYLPRLRYLEIRECPKLKDVVHLDAMCSLYLVIDEDEHYLPAWLVKLAATHRQRSEAYSSTAITVTEIFRLHLVCGSALLRRCLEEGGEYWPIIQQFPEVTIYGLYPSKESLAYTRTPRTYKANLAD